MPVNLNQYRVLVGAFNNHSFPSNKECLLIKVKHSILNDNVLSFRGLVTFLNVALHFFHFKFLYPAGNCMFKVNNRNTRTRCEICSKLTIKTPERR